MESLSKNIQLMLEFLNFNVDFNAGKNQFILFERSYKTSSMGVKMDGSVLEEKLSFVRCWGCLYLLNWIRLLDYVYC